MDQRIDPAATMKQHRVFPEQSKERDASGLASLLENRMAIITSALPAGLAGPLGGPSLTRLGAP